MRGVGKRANEEILFRKWLAQSFGSKGKHRQGVLMSGMMDCCKRESGSEFEWKEMGFPKLANSPAM